MRSLQLGYRKLFLFPLLALLLISIVPVAVAMLQKHPVRVSAAGQMPYVHGNQIMDGFGHPLILRGAHIQTNLVAIKPYVTPTPLQLVTFAFCCVSIFYAVHVRQFDLQDSP